MQPTGLVSIDRAWGGGLPRGLLVEVAGASGSGKTQLAMSLLARVLEARRESCVLILQAEKTCAVERLAEICGYQTQLLDRVLIEHVDTKETLLALLTGRLKDAVFAAVLIDSVAALFRYEDCWVDRSGALIHMTHVLKHQLAEQPLLLCLNQVTQNGDVPALGLQWSNCVNIRLLLRKRPDGRRFLRVLHHPWHPPFPYDIPIEICARGVVEVE